MLGKIVQKLFAVGIVFMLEPEIEKFLAPYRKKLYASGILPPVNLQ